MPTTTTTYSFNKPVVGADEDDWGGYLNGNWDSVDDLLDGTTPVTGIDINSGTLDGVTIGGTTAGAGTFTTLTANTSITGTLATAAQPNITSVGTLTGLTVSASASLAGASTSADITFGDNDKAIFGAGSDLQIYHNGSNSYIDDAGDGALLIRSNEVRLNKYTGEYMLRAFADGAVSLYYDQGTYADPKLSTTSTGVDITGTLTADACALGSIALPSAGTATIFNRNTDNNLYIQTDSGNTVYLLDGSQNTMYAASPTSHIFQISNAEKMRIDSSGNVGIGTTSPSNFFGYTTLDVYNANAGGAILARGSSVEARFVADDPTGTVQVKAQSNHPLMFATSGSERMRIDSSGNVGIGLADPSSYGKFVVSGTSTQLAINSSSGKSRIGFFEGGAGRFYIDTLNGSDGLAFVDGNGTTERMRIDSSGNVGIGTSSPASVGVAGMPALSLMSTTSGRSGGLYWQDTGGTTVANSYFFGSVFNLGTETSHPFAFRTGDTERMRIDSSGNLLVGTTSTDPIGTLDSGMRIGDGFFNINRTGASGFFGRSGSDGNILQFYKDGTNVGTIGTGNSSSYIYMGTGDTGIMTNSGNDFIQPWNPSTNSTRTDAISLGNSSSRFKDLYLSGGVYLGGTGSANKLDDYEEGTWTPRIEGYSGSDVGTTQTYSQQSGVYTRIGRMVYASFAVRLSNKGDIGGNYTIIRGFPFGHAGSRGGSFIMDYFWSMGTTVSFIGGELGGGASTSCWVTKVSGTGSTGSSYLNTSDIGNSTGFQGTLVYRVS